ncbi:MAG: hypothetical protein CMM87_00405 [Rickettsiales bacterium]|nr:hypothetical protein [Rickettsiales bacterium]|tara:strand:+ start:16096 stop:17127 length:1032 start_codon:yes stop_codon:yes gene_type:complete
MTKSAQTTPQTTFGIFWASLFSPLTHFITFLRFCSVPIFYQLVFGVAMGFVAPYVPAFLYFFILMLGQAFLFLFFDTLFDVSVSRLCDGQAKGTGISKLSFYGCGWRTFFVNVKLILIFLPAFILLAAFVLHSLGSFHQPVSAAVQQYFYDASVMPPTLRALVERTLINLGVAVFFIMAIALYFYSRFSVAEPAAALGENPHLSTAWHTTHANKTLLYKIHWLLFPLYILVSWSGEITKPTPLPTTNNAKQPIQVAASETVETTANGQSSAFSIEYKMPKNYDLNGASKTTPAQTTSVKSLFSRGALMNLLLGGASLLIGYLFSFISGFAVTLGYRKLSPRKK